MKNSEIVYQIEKDQKARLLNKKENLYKYLDRPTRRQIDTVAENLRIIMSNDIAGHPYTEIIVWNTVFKSSLTLDKLHQIILKRGKVQAEKFKSIESFIEDIVLKYEKNTKKHEIKNIGEKVNGQLFNSIKTILTKA